MKHVSLIINNNAYALHLDDAVYCVNDRIVLELFQL